MPAGARRKPSGPLDERLVDIAEELLDRDGLEALSLRRIARRAGVSHGAPLRHYPSLAALLSQVAARGFRLLSETIDKSAAQLPSGAGPWARLSAAGRGYVELAVARPGLFALMFRPEALDPQNAELARASADAFEQLVRLVRAAQDAGWRAEHDTRLLAGCVWAAVHGLALLWAQGAFSVAAAASGATLDDALRTTMQLVHGDPRGGIR
ncbi:MAG TPA: TetR/AcrR family transcriptional regulator [Myxococcota bacterium]|nr:TetR/AcrR family transcriptional regulator [Myxococcota bacterium]